MHGLSTSVHSFLIICKCTCNYIALLAAILTTYKALTLVLSYVVKVMYHMERQINIYSNTMYIPIFKYLNLSSNNLYNIGVYASSNHLWVILTI